MSRKWHNSPGGRRARIEAEAAAQPLTICGASEGFELLAEATQDGAAPKLRRFGMVAYTGAAMTLGNYTAPVVVDLAGMAVPSQTRPILYGHDTDRIVGHSEAVDVSTKQLKLRGVISGVGDDAERVQAMAANGFPWQASIGASVQKMEFIDAGSKVQVNGRSFHGPVYVARQTVLGEVSFVPIGADGATSATVAAKQREGSAMIETTNGAATAQPPEAPAVATPATVQAAAPPAPAIPDPTADIRARVAAEMERVAAVQAAAKDNPAIAAKAVREGWTAERTELEVLRASRPTGPGVIVRDHDRDCTREALAGAMILRAGGRLDDPSYQSVQAIGVGLPSWLRQGINAEQRQRAMEFAHRYSDLSAVDICREALRLDGRDAPLGRKEMIRAAFSGGALTNIFTDSVNARLLAAYMAAPDTTQGWTSEVDVADFKTQERPRLAVLGTLAKLPRGQEADHVSRSDSAESYKIARYAGQFVVDEQDIIDDMLNAFATMPTDMGASAARLRPDLVYAILLANDTLTTTSRALFNATDANLDTSSALAAATLRAGVASFPLFKENGVTLNLRATHLIVPPSLMHLAAELINSATIIISSAGTSGAQVNVERGTMNALQADNLTRVVDGRLENGVTDPASGTAHAGSATTWFMASSMAHTVEVGYLRGTGRVPAVRAFTLSEGRWGVGWDINMDIGAKALDYRGLFKATA